MSEQQEYNHFLFTEARGMAVGQEFVTTVGLRKAQGWAMVASWKYNFEHKLFQAARKRHAVIIRRVK